MHTPLLRPYPTVTPAAATTLATGSNALTELFASASRQHALRLSPPTPAPTPPTALQARHAHD